MRISGASRMVIGLEDIVQLIGNERNMNKMQAFLKKVFAI